MKKTVKAWAVIDHEILKKDKEVFNLMWNPTIERMNNAVFPFKEYAEVYAERISRGYKAFVVPCTITYTIPSPN